MLLQLNATNSPSKLNQSRNHKNSSSIVMLCVAFALITGFFYLSNKFDDKQLKPTNQKVDLKKLAACQNILLESSQCTPLKDQEMQKLTILFQGIIEITKENTIKRANTIIISIPNITENQKDTLSQLPKNQRMDIDYDENKNLVLIFIQISDLPKVDEESHNPLTID